MNRTIRDLALLIIGAPLVAVLVGAWLWVVTELILIAVP